MTEHDGLTAEQEAERRYPTPEYHQVFMPTVTIDGIRRELRRAFREGAKWATEREKARAEAAEARVAELEAMLTALVSKWDEVLPEIRATATIAYVHGHRYTGPHMAGVIREARELLTSPTTEAVTEVEGS